MIDLQSEFQIALFCMHNEVVSVLVFLFMTKMALNEKKRGSYFQSLFVCLFVFLMIR